MKSKTEYSGFRNDKKSNSSGIKLINPERVPLTPEILKTFPDYKNIDEESAKETYETIKAFARVDTNLGFGIFIVLQRVEKVLQPERLLP